MPNNTSELVERASKTFPKLSFQKSGTFRWSPKKQAVFFRNIKTAEDAAMFLHELGHANLGHRDFTSDIDLLQRENDAWRRAQKKLAPTFNLEIDEELIQDHLDTYRDWLWRRSQCPECAQTGLQTGEYRYECVNCGGQWKVNDARVCELRRYATT